MSLREAVRWVPEHSVFTIPMEHDIPVLPLAELRAWLRDGLQEISEGRGPYAMDNYEFAVNVIENGKAIAQRLLAELDAITKPKEG